jgi:protein SCO1
MPPLIVDRLRQTTARTAMNGRVRFPWRTAAPRILLAVAMPLLFAAAGSPAKVRGQIVTGTPQALEGVGIDEQLNRVLPLDDPFLDDKGRPVRLRDYFQGERPVILSLNYADCPLLCQLQLQGLVTSLRDLDWNAGTEFSVLSVSIDPSETWQQASLAKRRHLQGYGRPGTAAGWNFLTGRQENIQKLADAVGFRYRYVADRGEYAHTAALILCTPDGRVSRYLYGVEYPAQTVRLSLVEAAEGRIGSTVDRVLLFCFHYDAESGRYGPSARRLMQLGGFLTVAVLVLGLAPYWLWSRACSAAGLGESPALGHASHS